MKSRPVSLMRLIVLDRKNILEGSNNELHINKLLYYGNNIV